MDTYILKNQSAYDRLGRDTRRTIRSIANRYISENPPVPYTYYLRSKDNFSITEDYLDEIKLHEKHPDMNMEDYVYAWALFEPEQAGPFHFRFSAYGPVAIFVNGRLAYRTTHVQERFADQVTDICLDLAEGANSLLFQCICTPLGCGFKIGSSSYKGRRIQFFSPLQEWQGFSGFLYSQPLKKPLAVLPVPEAAQKETGVEWYPRVTWSNEEKNAGVVKRLFGDIGNQVILGVTRFFISAGGSYTIKGYAENETVIYLDDVYLGRFSGHFSQEWVINAGEHLLSLIGREADVKVFSEKGSEVPLLLPLPVKATAELSWIYAGPFAHGANLNLKQLLKFDCPIETMLGESYWHVDLPSVLLRPFNEKTLYGEWNYPLGVTLYGLVQAARFLDSDDIQAYVKGHMNKCTSFYKYSLWDKETYGAAAFHNQLMTIDSLDDCGSFASALLEVMKDQEIQNGRKICDMVAAYIVHQQQRLADGTFYRNDSYLPIMNQTIWADDMYMGIPFLCRYYQETGQEDYLQEGIRQIKNFYSYLFMPDLSILSHIYDTRYQVQTKVPWGRGNGWALFSIAELLTVTPVNHQDRPEILQIFRQLSEGYLKLQGRDGMWHQVLTMADSYLETSCTAMFIYGFARGVRQGWYEDLAPYAESAWQGWLALSERAIDWKGNIYGVCGGSGYSFSKEYYAKDLAWRLNDTHGTGIVLLAGIEVEKMLEGK